MKYDIVYADPPWRFKNYSDDWNSGRPESRWVGNEYALMGADGIESLPVASIASDNCALFMWCTFPTIEQAFRVIKAWGFTYKTVAFTWIKTTKSEGKPAMGMGYWTRSNAEVVLLATKGHPKRVSASVGQVIMEPRREHSRKPDVTRERILQLMGDLPRVELFARQSTPGWDVWGNEVDSTVSL